MSLETCIPAKGYLSYSTGLPRAEIILVEAVLAEVRATRLCRSELLFLGDPSATPADRDTSTSDSCLGFFGFFVLVFFSLFFAMILSARPCGYLRRLQEEGSKLEEVQLHKTGDKDLAVALTVIKVC